MVDKIKMIKSNIPNRIFTWSENPSVDLWNHLMFLSKKDNVTNLLSGAIRANRAFYYEKGDDLDRKANQISLSIGQAFEYFKAAEAVTISTKPLLYFYGMLSLAKALIVANNKELFLESLNYHGLTQIPKDENTQKYREEPKSWVLEKEYAVVLPGVFNEFAKVVTGFEFPINSTILLKDAFAICPEISKVYEMYYNEPSRTLNMYDFEEKSSKPYVFEISFEVENEKEIFDRIPEFKTEFTMLPALKHGLARTFKSKELEHPPEYLGIYYPPVGGNYAVKGLRYSLNSTDYCRYVDPIVVDYLTLYILSMCVRYKQELWGESTQGQHSGAVPLIELYISTAKRRFVNEILNQLFGLAFWYGSPTYLC